MRKYILFILGILLIIAAVFFAKYLIKSNTKTRPAPKKVVKTIFIDTVKNKSIPIVIKANGSLMAKRRLEIYAEVQGIFKAGTNLFKQGQNYKKGETFIRIDDSEYNANVQSSKSNLYNSIAAILADLRLDFPEVFPKWQKYLQKFDLDKETPALPKMTSDKENYFITGRNIVTNYYNVKNLEQRLSKYNISVPFNGVLTEALVTEGTLIRSGQKLGEYIDPMVYEMEVAISKSFISQLKIGKEVILSNLEQTETYTGKVIRINGSIDQNTQTVAVFIEVKSNQLKEGMYLEAKLQAKKEKNAIEINRGLLLDGNQIFVVKDNLLDLIVVDAVHFSNSKVVLKNIPDGTVILSKPVPGAYAGMQVKTTGSSTKTSETKKNK